MNLPIDLIPNTNPPCFRWRQIINTPFGDSKTIECKGRMMPSVEGAVAELINIVKQQARDIEEFKQINMELADRVAAQSELLGKRVEVQIPVQQVIPKKGR